MSRAQCCRPYYDNDGNLDKRVVNVALASGPILLTQSHQPVQGGLAEHMLKEKLINLEVVLEYYRRIFSVDEYILVKVSSKDDSTDSLVLTLVGACEKPHLLSLEERPREEVGYL